MTISGSTTRTGSIAHDLWGSALTLCIPGIVGFGYDHARKPFFFFPSPFFYFLKSGLTEEPNDVFATVAPYDLVAHQRIIGIAGTSSRSPFGPKRQTLRCKQMSALWGNSGSPLGTFKVVR